MLDSYLATKRETSKQTKKDGRSVDFCCVSHSLPAVMIGLQQKRPIYLCAIRQWWNQQVNFKFRLAAFRFGATYIRGRNIYAGQNIYQNRMCKRDVGSSQYMTPIYQEGKQKTAGGSMPIVFNANVELSTYACLLPSFLHMQRAVSMATPTHGCSAGNWHIYIFILFNKRLNRHQLPYNLDKACVSCHTL